MNKILDQDIKYLKGVGPKRSVLLARELNIYTFKDLLYHFPYKYIDRSKIFRINEINTTQAFIQIRGKIITFRTEGHPRRKRLVALFSDGSDSIELVWFRGINWVMKSYQTDREYIVFGRPALFNSRISIAHPEIEPAEKSDEEISSSFSAQYRTTEKLKSEYISSKTIQKLISNLISLIIERVMETLPDYLVRKLNLISLKDALFNIHFPKNTKLLEKATYRLKFEELFLIQLNILKQKYYRQHRYKGFVFSKVGDYLNDFYRLRLSFDLTEAQKRVIKEIRKDLGSGRQMNRLLQGDVGSGKTLVALMVMLIALDNGFQACIMAPTEILANQHFNTISKFLEGIDVNLRLLTGSTRKSDRVVIQEELSNGSLQILIGTHALLEDPVRFDNLGLVIIDEMPPGRKPIKTYHYYDSKRLPMFGFLRKQIKEGRQIYVVYPMIKESEKMDYKYLEDGYEAFVRAFPPPEYVVTCVHGQMKTGDKDSSMKLFVNGKSHILIATTVIEVGVDVPNATVMVIESAERFGLSQLHQLRGRVGRGADQSYCILMTSHKLTSEARKRIETMVSTNDGFEIAEVDLKLRGPGDLEGTQQSGIPFELKISNLSKDGQLIQYARNIAEEILDNDSDLSEEHNRRLIDQLALLKRTAVDWSIIS